MKNSLRLSLFVCITASTLLSGCRSTYYKTMEKVGVHKRDILVDRVQDGRDAQDKAKKQFKSAYEELKTMVEIKGGDLEKKYNRLSRTYDKSKARAEDVNDRVRAIDRVANDMFREWRKEIGQYSNDTYRRESQRQLDGTRKQYVKLIDKMQEAAGRMQPVLDSLGDQVLFLKHNLNSRAIASIQSEAVKIEEDVARLIRKMEESISEADAFIKEMGTP